MKQETLPETSTLISESFPEAVLETHEHRGDETLVIERSEFLKVCEFLRDDSRCKFEMMMDLTAVDRLEQDLKPRFEVVYHFKSLSLGKRLRLKVHLEEKDSNIDSIHHLWKAVNWYERECYDMYGIIFNNHPDLRRILMYDQFEGHPLLKDYPMDRQQPISELREVEERNEYERSV